MAVTAVTPEERMAVVSDLARGRSVQDVAARHRLAVAIVTGLKNEFGPGMGELAHAAETLRIYVPKAAAEASPSPALTTTAVDTTLFMLDKAAAFPRLATKAAKATQLLAEIRDEFAAAEKIAELEAVAAKRRADLADAEKALAEAKGYKKLATTKEPDSPAIRAWAKEQGIECPSHGRVPQSVVDAWKGATK